MRQKRRRRLLYIGAAAVVLAAFCIFGAALLLPTHPYSMPTPETSSAVESEFPARFPRLPELPVDSSSSSEEALSESAPSLPDNGGEEQGSAPTESEADEPKPATPSSRKEPPPVSKPEPIPQSEPEPDPTPEPEPEAEEITLESSTVTLAVGESAEIRMASAPARVLNYGATWQVDNKLVADFVTADRRGVTIQGKHKGKTKVTVTSKDGSLSASCLVTVI